MKKEYLVSTASWAILFMTLVVPLFFNVGYGLFDAETWIIALASLAVAPFAAWILPFGTTRCGVAAGLFAVAYIDLYVPMLIRNWLIFALVLVTTLALSIAFPRRAVAIVAIALCAGFVGAYLQRPQLMTVKVLKQLSTTNTPTVIHLLLDEQASDWGFPRDVIPQAELDNMWALYIKRGFVLFDRSYSLDTQTPESVPRIFNPGIVDVETTVTHVGGNTQVTSASAFNKIAQQRALNVIGLEFINFASVLHRIDNVEYFANYNSIIGGSAARASGATIKDRMIVAVGVTWSWLFVRQRSPRIRWITTHIGFFERLYGARARANAPNALLIVSEFIQRVRSAKRGEYYFIHLMLPHGQTVLDEECQGRYWSMAKLQPGSTLIAARADRYRRYFQQVRCTQKQVFSILDAIETNPQLRDATIIIHGDHGSRINVPSLEDWLATGRSRDEFERDGRAAFMAIRIPGFAAQRVKRQADVNEVYQRLLESDFRVFNIDSLSHSDPTLGGCPALC